MWRYEKRLQYPVNIKTPNPKIAQYIMSQYGGPDGEIGASMRYLSQRYTMPYKMQKGLLTDIGTEELAHMEMIAAIVQQLTRNLTPAQIESSGFGPYYIDHTTAIWPQEQAESRSMRASSSRRAMRSRIYMRIWQQSRKPAQLTTIFSAWSKIRKYAIRSVFCASGRLYIFSGLVKL